MSSASVTLPAPLGISRLVVFAGTLLAAGTILIGLPSDLEAQIASGRPNVFFDCEGRDCNDQYYRTEIDWVNWVNDHSVSDVHVIMGSTTTGAGGREYRIDFIGRDIEEGYLDEMLYQAQSTDTDRERLDAVAHALAIGLARFASAAGYRDLVSLVGPDPESSARGMRVVSQEEVDDPWNLWVFRINANGNFDREETRSTDRFSGSLNASRVTPTWKLNFRGNASRNEREFELSDGTFRDTRTDWGFNPLIVYALADNWSVALQGQVARMTQVNQKLRWEVTPAIEYSVFPYEEATRRAFTFSYKIGPAFRDYFDETIFGEFSETRWEESVEVDFSSRQTWGDAGMSLSGSHFLHDTGLYNLSLRGDIDFRITRGFSINARANVSRVRDQIYLSAGGATDEEALLQLRRRATDFTYGGSIGFSFQFGSIFNNVVNNRFRGGGGGFGGFGGGGGGGGFGRF